MDDVVAIKTFLVMKVRKRIVKHNLQSILFYGLVSWEINNQKRKISCQDNRRYEASRFE